MRISGQRTHTPNVPRTAGRDLSDPSVLPERFVESWHRCRDVYRIDRETKLKARVLTRSEWRERYEKLERFLVVADAHIASLHKKLSGLTFCVMVTDSNGATLDLRNGTISNDHLNQISLVRGACWPEDVVGTGGIGTALYEGAPVLVHREEHFHPQLFEMSCSASPICDVNGDTLAVLDATGLHITSDLSSQILIYGLVVETAAMIENAWFLTQSRDHWVIELSKKPGFFTGVADQMIAFDESGLILGGNKAARADLLSNAQAEISNLDRLFDVQPGNLIYASQKQPGHVHAVYSYRNGVREQFYARLRGPSLRRPAASHDAPGSRMEKQREAIGQSQITSSDPQVKADIAMAGRLIDGSLPILVLGETGTGKEVFAHAVHDQSRRRDKPFVAINCASIPETLIESELFGYRPGAFTGAKAKGAQGKIQQANGGTLFLDEIGDMPLPLQTRLLRVLAEGEVAPLGSGSMEKVDLNIICATHRDLSEMVRQGKFREDLYYRLNTAAVHLLPLRERSDLRQLLSQVFTEEAAAAERESLRLSPEVQDLAASYRWPGNIRQLRNAIRFAVAICDDTEVDTVHLPPEITRPPAASTAHSPAVAESRSPLDAKSARERDRMIDQLRHHQWRVTKAAEAIDVPRATFYRRMKRYGIVTPNQAASDSPQSGCHRGGADR